MRALLAALIVTFSLAGASPVFAEGSMAGGGGGEVFVAIQGKFVSVLGNDSGLFPLPAFPATFFNAVLVPSKYKSKKFFLTIATSAQYIYDGDVTASAVFVGGIPAFPDPFAAFYFDASDGDADTEGFNTRGRNWFMIREIDGGPFIAPVVSLVELHQTSAFGTAATNTISIIARREK